MKPKKYTQKQEIQNLKKVATQNFVAVKRLDEVIADLQKIVMAMPDFQDTIDRIRTESEEEE